MIEKRLLFYTQTTTVKKTVESNEHNVFSCKLGFVTVQKKNFNPSFATTGPTVTLVLSYIAVFVWRTRKESNRVNNLKRFV